MLTILFAWSWGGHGQITAAAVVLAVSSVLRLGRSGLITQLTKLAPSVAMLRPAGSPPLKVNFSDSESAIRSLVVSLPARVQQVDLHLGNLPVVGEKIDDEAQVRHFMRSTRATNSQVAFTKSMTWIRTHLLLAREKMSDALNKKYEKFQIFSSNAGDFLAGLSLLADALHTAEDSYAQGHATRDAGNTNIIRGLNYWDTENKEGNKASGQLGHDEYDDPGKQENRVYVEASKVTAGELIACVLGSLDRTLHTFVSDLDLTLGIRFNYSPPWGDFPSPSAKSRPG